MSSGDLARDLGDFTPLLPFAIGPEPAELDGAQ